MSGSTPVFGIRYPEMGDPIGEAAFAELASDIDAVLAGTALLLEQRLNAPSAAIRTLFPGPAINPGVELTITWQAEDVDTDNMYDPLAQDRLTIRTAGVYQFCVSTLELGNSANWTTRRDSFYLNGVRWSSSWKHSTSSSSPAANPFTALIPCVVGDFVQVRAFFTGAGPAGQVAQGGVFTGVLVCRP